MDIVYSELRRLEAANSIYQSFLKKLLSRISNITPYIATEINRFT